MSEACRDLEKRPKASGPETLRVIIPRAVEFLYTLRNKRDIGHVGGDVDANVIDSIMIVRLADWILAELVRVTHKVSLEEAQSVVDALATREVPVVWAVGGKKRVLNPSLTFREKSLLILYANETVSLVEDLFDWVEYSDLSHYKRDVLKRLHAAKLVEFDEILGTVELSPTGAAWVERHLHPADLFLA